MHLLGFWLLFYLIFVLNVLGSFDQFSDSDEEFPLVSHSHDKFIMFDRTLHGSLPLVPCLPNFSSF